MAVTGRRTARNEEERFPPQPTTGTSAKR